MEFVLESTLGVARLLTAVTVGVVAGTLLEATGLTNKAAFLYRPMLKLGRLSPVCGSSFVTAFLSPRAANSMLASAYSENRLSRRELIAGALANIFPSSLTHIRIMAFVLIPLLGAAGLAYVTFQVVMGFVCAATAITAAGFFAGGRREEESVDVPDYSGERKSFKEVLRQGFQRAGWLLRRVLCITVPIYVGVAALDYYGVFDSLTAAMPERLAALVPPASLSVMAAHLASVMNAAAAASELLSSGVLDGSQVFLTLLGGYLLSMPLRTVKHSIPAAAGIFPNREALVIVITGQLLRMTFTVSFGIIIYLLTGAE